jgi:2,4-dienoyl-CoA reductase-like NADH-dependent reductase (Old Yellow Enzyme family)
MPADAFAPARLGPLALRNRIIKTATYEGMCPGGVPSEQLVEHHRALAAGGVGMTTVAYCAVSADGRTFAEQMFMRPEVVAPLRRVTDAVHREGAAASLQLGHCGWFTKNKALSTRLPRGPSLALNAYGLSAGKPLARAMSEREIEAVIAEFGRAAGLARESGFDAVELHLGHGYLLSQFLCPATNRRRDGYGGSVDGRARLPLAVLRRVREVVGAGFPILCKTNLRDGFRGGLEVPEAAQIAQLLEREGADALVLSGGFTSKTPFFLFRGRRPLAEMIEVEKSRLQKLALAWFGRSVIREYPFEEMFFLAEAKEIRRAVRMPLVLLGGIVSRNNVERAMSEGFDFVAMGRALIANPDLVNRMQSDPQARSRCNHCNICVAEMDRSGVRCVLGEEATQVGGGGWAAAK